MVVLDLPAERASLSALSLSYCAFIPLSHGSLRLPVSCMYVHDPIWSPLELGQAIVFSERGRWG